jgi:hypothetical protein
MFASLVTAALLAGSTARARQDEAPAKPADQGREEKADEPKEYLTQEEFERLKLTPFGPRVPNRLKDGSRLRSVEAPALSGIVIDGDLGDWPQTIARHPIDSIQILSPFYGWNGLKGADLKENPDLTATFSVGYDPVRNVIYVAVVVRDDRHVIGNDGFWDTDAVEIFVDGRHTDDRIPRIFDEENSEHDAGDLAALQYIGIAGEGPIYGVKPTASTAPGPDNPILSFGDVSKTFTRMEYRRERGVTVYEWAVEAFDHYPDRPTELVPGKKIGFDVAVVDKDAPATATAPQDEPEDVRSAWISWWPGYYGPRFYNASDLGEIILGPRTEVAADAPKAE